MVGPGDAPKITFEVDPGKALQRALKKAQDKVDDLTIPLMQISREWFKSNRAIFAVKGRGKYQDLTEAYKKAKLKKWGFVYPILKASGRLSESITDPTHGESISQIVNAKTLILGSTVPYGAAHQFGVGHLPVRPWVLIGAEQVAPRELNRRLDAWVAMLQDHVWQVTQQATGGRT